MKKIVSAALSVILALGVTSCTFQEKNKYKHVTNTEQEALAVITELMEKANHANYLSAGICENNIDMTDLAGNKSSGTLEIFIGAETVEDIEKYFYSIFEKTTAEKYLLPITKGISIDSRTLPLYYNSENGLTLENRALADPLILGEWLPETVEIISAEQDLIRVSASYYFSYDPKRVYTGELCAVYDVESESWKLDASYGLSFVGLTEYLIEETSPIAQSIVENLLDDIEIAEAFLTKDFSAGTAMKFTDFYTYDSAGDENEKFLNTEILTSVKPEYTDIVTAEDPIVSIRNHFSSCFTPAFQEKFSVDEMFSYDADSGKLYVSPVEAFGFMNGIRDSYEIVYHNNDRIVLLVYDYETGFYEETDKHYRYVYIINHDGTWKVTESIMTNPVLHVPDMYGLYK